MDQLSPSKDARRLACAALGAVLGVLVIAPAAFAQEPGPVDPAPAIGFDFEPVSPLPGQQVLFAATTPGLTSPVWDFGDGGTSTDPAPRHAYAAPGTYDVTLTATDSGGATGTTEPRQLVVRDPAGPTASFTASPAVPLVGDVVTFTSTSQPSSLQSITALDWDLDDDGQFDDASGVSATRSFAFPGQYEVALRVQQSNGNAAAGELKVPVEARPSPPSSVASPPLAVPSAPSAAFSAQQPALSGPTFMAPFPVVRIVGKVFARATLIRVLSVRAPRGALVRVRCLGRGCPARAVRRRSSGQQLRLRQFQRRLRAGIHLEIFVRRPGTIGKYTRFRIRAGDPPKRIDRCLFPATQRPKRCP